MVNQFSVYFNNKKLYQDKFIDQLTKNDLENLYESEHLYNRELFKKIYFASNHDDIEIIKIKASYYDSNQRLRQILDALAPKTYNRESVKNYIPFKNII